MMSRRENMNSNSRGKTSLRELKALSLQEAMALSTTQSNVPRHIYGLEAERRELPENVRQQIRSMIVGSEVRSYREEVEVVFLMMLLTGRLRVCGINHKGRFMYAIAEIPVESQRTTAEVIARAHHQYVLETLQKRLLRHRKLDGFSILLMGLAGVLEFTGIDRNGDLEIKINKP